ncbi:MAG: hypothetical protein ACRDI2_07445 [Chloroflexota bacterium]
MIRAPHAHDAPAATGGATADEIPEVTDAQLAQARRGDFLPKDPAERARVLEERVRRLQRSGLQLQDEHDRLQEENARLRDVLRTARATLDLARPGAAQVASQIDRLLEPSNDS